MKICIVCISAFEGRGRRRSLIVHLTVWPEKPPIAMVFWTKSVRRILWRYVVCYGFIIPRFVLSGNKIEETNRLKDNLMT